MEKLRLWLMSLLVLAGLSALWAACDPAPTASDPVSPNREVLSSAVRLQNGMTLPAGSRVWDDVTASGEKVIRFELPEGAALVSTRGEASSEDTEPGEGGTITCRCDRGTGCSPFRGRIGGDVIIGCADTSNCSMCMMTVYDTDVHANGTWEIGHPQAAILDRTRGIRVITSKAQLDSLACAGEAVLSLPWVRDSLAAFLAPSRRDHPLPANVNLDNLPETVFMMPLDVFGTVVRVPASTAHTTAKFFSYSAGKASQMSDETDPVEDGAATCRCLAGGPGCVREAYAIPKVGQVEVCRAGACTTCQMQF